jgi:hypothetical protein
MITKRFWLNRALSQRRHEDASDDRPAPFASQQQRRTNCFEPLKGLLLQQDQNERRDADAA